MNGSENVTMNGSGNSSDASQNATNGSGEPFGELLTVSEAARSLGVSLPRLLRALDREPFTGRAEKRERATATGTRTVTMISASLLPALAEVLTPNGSQDTSENATPDATNGSEDATNATGEPFTEPDAVSDNGDDWRARALIAEAQAALLADALGHERDAHKRAQTLHLNTQGELAELRRRAVELEGMNARLVEALPTASPTVTEAAQDRPAEATGTPLRDTEAGGSAPQDETPARPQTGWFARLFGKGKGAA